MSSGSCGVLARPFNLLLPLPLLSQAFVQWCTSVPTENSRDFAGVGAGVELVSGPGWLVPHSGRPSREALEAPQDIPNAGRFSTANVEHLTGIRRRGGHGCFDTVAHISVATH